MPPINGTAVAFRAGSKRRSTSGGFLLIYYLLLTHPLSLFGALLTGAVISFIILMVMVHAEPFLMHLRGYREPSRREREKLSPLLLDTANLMGLDVVPDYWISESKKPAAWAHMRALVVTRGLLGDYDDSESPPRPELDDSAISAILAHELSHWQKGDVVGTAMVTACFFPFVLIVNGIQWLRLRAEWGGVILWLFFWPVWVCSRFVVVPLMSHASRRHEFEADARAASLGDKYRLGLRRALTELSVWELPRTGWEEVLAATHPPIELRLERLEEPPPAPAPAPAQDMRVRIGPADDPEAIFPSPRVQASARKYAQADAHYKKVKESGSAAEIPAATRAWREATLEEWRAILQALETGEYELRRGGPTWVEDQKARLAANIENMEAKLRSAGDAKPQAGTTRPRRPPGERAKAERPAPSRPAESTTSAPHTKPKLLEEVASQPTPPAPTRQKSRSATSSRAAGTTEPEAAIQRLKPPEVEVAQEKSARAAQMPAKRKQRTTKEKPAAPLRESRNRPPPTDDTGEADIRWSIDPAKPSAPKQR